MLYDTIQRSDDGVADIFATRKQKCTDARAVMFIIAPVLVISALVWCAVLRISIRHLDYAQIFDSNGSICGFYAKVAGRPYLAYVDPVQCCKHMGLADDESRASYDSARAEHRPV